MNEKKYLIGRSEECDFVIYDPQNRVSRKHAQLIRIGTKLYIEDLGSANGTFVDGRQIKSNVRVPFTTSSKITLSKDYKFEVSNILVDDDSTRILEKKSSISVDNNEIKLSSGEKTVIFDRNKARLEDLSKHDKSGFKLFGRGEICDYVINQPTISKKHIRLRLLTQIIFEIEDLGSTNGTFVDGEKLTPNRIYQFATTAKIKLGQSHTLNLKQYFPAVIIPEKRNPPIQPKPQNIPNTTPTRTELTQFQELENVWKEYNNRLNQANSVASGFSIGGAVFGLAAAALTGATGGVGGLLLMSGGGILGRYLGQKESSKIRGDLTFEDAFLEVYACPRCNESFQKKPWITIRECYRCKTKFR